MSATEQIRCYGFLYRESQTFSMQFDFNRTQLAHHVSAVADMGDVVPVVLTIEQAPEPGATPTPGTAGEGGQ